MKFNFQGKATQVDFSYPWLPSKCTNCGKWGHTAKACMAPEKKEEGNVEVGMAEENMKSVQMDTKDVEQASPGTQTSLDHSEWGCG